MKTKQYNESYILGHNSCHSSMIYEVDGKKFKLTYTNGNSYERYSIEMFDGLKLNLIAGMSDLNIKKNGSAYINTDIENEKRSAHVHEEARKYIKMLLS